MLSPHGKIYELKIFLKKVIKKLAYIKNNDYLCASLLIIIKTY